MPFNVGDKVIKSGGDYFFEGVVVASFSKRDLKTIRYVVENDDGVLHIFSDNQLVPADLVERTVNRIARL